MARRGYVQLRRGILDHLPNMSGAACKVYVTLLCIADFQTGEARLTVRELATVAGMSAAHVAQALRELEQPLPGRDEGYVVWHRGTNRFTDSVVQVTRYAKGEG
jgi:hypothetical protein